MQGGKAPDDSGAEEVSGQGGTRGELIPGSGAGAVEASSAIS